MQQNIWQLNWLNEANPNDKEILINGKQHNPHKQTGGGREGEREDRQTDRETELLGFIHYVTDSITPPPQKKTRRGDRNSNCPLK